MCECLQNQSEVFNPSTILNLIILSLNLFFTLYLNFRAFEKRKLEERNYKIRYDFYKDLVINNIPYFIEMPNTPQKYLIELLSHKYEDKDITGDYLRGLIEEHCNKIYKDQEIFYNKYRSLIACYSSQMEIKFYNIVEKFFDESTDLMTKLLSPGIERTSRTIYSNKFESIKANYLKNLFEIIKQFNPNSAI